MAGITDFLSTDEAALGLGLLAASGPTTDPNQTGLGRVLAAGTQFANAQRRANAELAIREGEARRKAMIENLGIQLLTGGSGIPAGVATAGSSDASTPGVGQPATGALIGPGAGPAAAPALGGVNPQAAGADLLFNAGKGIGGMISERTAPKWTNVGGNLVNTNAPGFSGGIQRQIVTGRDGQVYEVAEMPDGRVVTRVDPSSTAAFQQFQDISNTSRAQTTPGSDFIGPDDRKYPRSQAEQLGIGSAPLIGPGAGVGYTGNPMVDAVMHTESRGNLSAVSAAGASGTMQTMPGTLTAPGFGVTPAKDSSAAEKQRVGVDYWNAMTERYKDPALAAVAYNWGPDNADKWIAAGADFNKLPRETRDYVGQVMLRNGINSRGAAAASNAAVIGPGAGPAPLPVQSTLNPSRAATEFSPTELAGQAARQKAAESAAGQTGAILKEAQDAANSAVQTVGSANRLRTVLDSGTAFTGKAAGAKLTVSQWADALGITGKDAADKAAQTRAAIQDLAKLTLEGRQQMRGQGAITESESKLAQQAISGDIDFSPAELRVLADAADRSARFKYKVASEQLGAAAQGNPALAAQVPMFRPQPLPDPWTPAAKAAAPNSSAIPSGWTVKVK